MSQQRLSDLLKGYEKEFQQAADGIAPGGNWDTDLPVNLEYRATVTKAEYGKAKNSGREQYTVTYEIQEPEEYAGAMLQQYIDPNPTQTWQVEQFVRLLGALHADPSLADDPVAFAKSFEDHSVVLTVQKWGEAGNERNGVRYVNADRGQVLKTNVAPKKAGGNAKGANLRPDINIPKDEPTTDTQAAAQTPPVNIPLPGAAQGGVNLPPGLRG